MELCNFMELHEIQEEHNKKKMDLWKLAQERRIQSRELN